MSEEHDFACEMLTLAKLMHDMADKLWDTQVPADIMHRLNALADDMQQLASD